MQRLHGFELKKEIKCEWDPEEQAEEAQLHCLCPFLHCSSRTGS